MSLEELERRLEESLKSLREDNKSMIDLLQSRQSEFCRHLQDAEPSASVENDIVQDDKVRSSQPDIIGISQPVNPKSAREKLSSLSSKSSNRYCTKSRTNETRSKANDEGKLRKSILKKRQIIDDNVHVSSKFEHDFDLPAEKTNRLNFSYDDVHVPVDCDVSAQDLERLADLTVPKATDIDANAERYLEHLQTQRKIKDDLQQFEKSRDERLITDSGNDRRQASVVRSLSERPKNSLFDLNEPDQNSLEETMKRYKGNNISPQTKNAKSTLKRFNYGADLSAARQGPPLLGYDWIAGVLENEGIWSDAGPGTSDMTGEQLSDELFQVISEFRKQNRAECVSSGPIYDHSVDLTRPISPQIEDPGHTCIHGYNVNERLFTEAVNLDEDGQSVCPVCLAARKPPTAQEPAFVRVSIPKSTVDKAYKIKPHTRKSFQPCDSMALSHHCLAGYKSNKPHTLPTARNLDIKGSVRSKETTTYDDARQVAESFSRMGRLLTSKGPATGARQERLTQRLIDQNTSFRYEMQTIQRLSGLDETQAYRTLPKGKA